MTRRRPTVLLVMGLVGLGLGMAYLTWLVVAQQSILFDLFTGGLGDPVAVSSLARKNLASPVAVYATVVSFFLELVLTLILLWTASGMINMRPSSRWAAVFYGIFMIPVGVFNVILAMFILATPAHPVDLLAVLARGIIVLYAIVLWGTMFLPPVVAAYAGDFALPETADDAYEDEAEPEPAAPRRRGRHRYEDEH
jgi:hypothetical protein